MHSIIAENIAKHLQRVFLLFEYPKKIWSENGPQFTSWIFAKHLQTFAKDHTIEHKPSYSHWPEWNGKVEHFNGYIYKLLQSAMLDQKNWKAAPHSATVTFPVQMMFDHSLNNGIPSIQQQHPQSKSNTKRINQTSKPMLIKNVEQKLLILIKERKY